MAYGPGDHAWPGDRWTVSYQPENNIPTVTVEPTVTVNIWDWNDVFPPSCRCGIKENHTLWRHLYRMAFIKLGRW